MLFGTIADKVDRKIFVYLFETGWHVTGWHVTGWLSTLCIAEDGFELLVLLPHREAGVHVVGIEPRSSCMLGKDSTN